MKHRKRLLIVLISVMMIACFAGIMAACGGGGGGLGDIVGGLNSNKMPDTVSAESITYDGSVIRWNSAAYAKYYYVNINGSADLRSDATTYTYPAAAVSSDSIEIAVRAVNDNGESEKATKTFYRMPTIDAATITFEADGMMVWPAISGAASYTVEINGVEHQTVINTFSDFVYGQVNNIRVKANGADSTYFSSYGSVISKTFLATPTGITYDGIFITWRGVSSATSYSVFINGGELPEKYTSTTIQYDSQRVDFTIEVRANGDGTNVFNSAKSEVAKFYYLQQPTNIRVEAGYLMWDEVDKATGYQLDVNGAQTTITGNQYQLIAGRTLRVRIKPIATSSDVYFSDWTNEESYFVLEAPTLSWNRAAALDGEEGRNLVWNTAGNNVNGYNIRITTPSGNIESRTTTADNPSLLYGYTAVGTYKVAVQAIAVVGTGTYDSAYSEELTVVRLAAPTQSNTNFITSDDKDLSAGFTVNFNAVSGAKQYRLYKNGVDTNQVTNSQSMRVTQVVESNVTEMQIIQYALQSIGSNGNVEYGIVTLDSLSSQSLFFDITVLARPENVQLSGQTMTWDGVAQANGYVVNRGEYDNANNDQYDLGNISDAGTYQISVCSKGNGGAVLPSFYTPSVTVTKLAAPSYIRADTGIGGGMLQFDHDNNARSYNIYINGADMPIEEDRMENLNAYITQNTCTIIIVAVADWYVGNVYYLSSNRSAPKQFTKLSAVTFPNPAFTNTELQWNAPANLQNGNISYAVFDETGTVYNERQDGTRFDLSAFTAGFYSFQVQALGDGENFINSDKSTTVDITKLDTPTVTRTQTTYQWRGVASASRYIVYVDGQQVDIQDHIGMGTYEYKPTFLQVKEYKVEVVAVGDFYTTIDSAPATLMQQIKRISTPTFNLSYDQDAFTEDGNIVVTITSSGEHVTAYRYSFNGTLAESQTVATVYNYNAKNPDTYNVVVTAVGGIFDEDGVYWYDSQPTAASPITLHAAPNSDTIMMNRDGVITWTAVPGCSQYEVTIVYSDGTQTTVTAQGARYVAENSDSVVSITIRALGNGTTTVTSKPVTWYRN